MKCFFFYEEINKTTVLLYVYIYIKLVNFEKYFFLFFEMDDEFKYKSKVFEIVPNTKRNQELRAKKIAEENQRKQEAEKVCFSQVFT